MNNSTSAQTKDQYSLTKILGIWATAAVPVGILGWMIFPAVSPDVEIDPFGAAVTRVLVITVGLIWLFVLSMIIVYREEGDLRWNTIKRRLRLNTPCDPKTGETRGKLWLWLIPFILLYLISVMLINPPLDGLWVRLFPFLDAPPGFDPGDLLEYPIVKEKLLGAWWFLGLWFFMSLFNTVLGEEFLFRGVLLPKMNGVFGKWDWVANGVLFALYHLNQPWAIPGYVVYAFSIALPAKRFRSTWMSIIVHSTANAFFAVVFLGYILGLA
ncbi:lysostaphin resistance A-like protein [Chloroflexota bacterium]